MSSLLVEFNDKGQSVSSDKLLNGGLSDFALHDGLAFIELLQQNNLFALGSVFGKDGVIAGDTEGIVVHLGGNGKEDLGGSRFDIL